MVLKNSKLIKLSFFCAIVFPMLLVWLTQNYTKDVQTGVMVILLLAIVAGLTLPNILLSWLILLLATIASAILLLGYVVIATGAKLMLLIAFPIEASLVFLIHQYIIDWCAIGDNQASISRYLYHFDSTVKLLSSYTARKIYNKIAQNIKNRPDLQLWTHVSLIQWANHEQYRQGNRYEHDQILQALAKIMKQTCLASEGIYYLGDAEFLILSPDLQDNVVEEIDSEMSEKLKVIEQQIPGGIKWVKERIDKNNIDKFQNAEELSKYLHRELETALIVEYLKDEDHD